MKPLLLFFFISSSLCMKIMHVHLSLTNDNTEMVVTWNTMHPLNKGDFAYVNFGTSLNSLTQTARGITTEWTDQGPAKKQRWTHRVVLQGLTPAVKYYYYAGCGTDVSDKFYFSLPSPTKPLKVCIFGDFEVNGNILDSFIKGAQNNEYDVVLHIGDIAYDLDSKDGTVGDTFMAQIEPVTSIKPYMVVAGNHEEKYDFLHYKNRFTMPSNGEINDNQFWSITLNNIHIIGISSEYYGYNISSMAQQQYNWLEKDLQKVTTPWILVFLHRPLYCSAKSSKGCNDYDNIALRGGSPGYPGLEPLFMKYGVDLVFWAHKHTYERLWPVYQNKVYKQFDPQHYHNTPTPVYTMTGAAGADSHHGPASTVPQPFTNVRLDNFGYTVLFVESPTAVQTWLVDASTRQQLDQFALTKEAGFKPGQGL